MTAQTVRRTLHYVNRCGRIQEKKSLFAVRHKTESLNFAEEHEKKPGEYWKHILWSDETKIHLFGSNGVQHVTLLISLKVVQLLSFDSCNIAEVD